MKSDVGTQVDTVHTLPLLAGKRVNLPRETVVRAVISNGIGMFGYGFRLRLFVFLCVSLSVLGILIGSMCSGRTCRDEQQQDIMPQANPTNQVTEMRSYYAYDAPEHDSYVGSALIDSAVEKTDFDITGNDVMVFLHIQKTGGTQFGRHLVKDLELKEPCVCNQVRKRCDCFRPGKVKEHWLFSRYSTGWRCGLHADWTELSSCVDFRLDQIEGKSKKRRYFYITFLRDPVKRYLSEFKHVQRGATWKTSRHMCGGREATPAELPPCYNGGQWSNVTLEQFMDCTTNLATNRQTRMLADLRLVGCYNTSGMSKSDRDRILLASAKANLASMAYIGITEKQKISQYIFEQTFKMKFVIPFEQLNTTVSSDALREISPLQERRLRQLNHLDVELYEFAMQLFFRRFARLKNSDPNFELNYQQMGSFEGRNFTWDDLNDDDSSR